MSIEPYPVPKGECLFTEGSPTLCLRVETPRERLALPYAGLVSVSLSADDTVMTVFFVTHRVTVKGRKLTEIFRAVATGSAHGLGVGRRILLQKNTLYNPSQRPEPEREICAIVSIRIESVEVAP